VELDAVSLGHVKTLGRNRVQINSTPEQARLRFSPRILCLALLAGGLLSAWQAAHAQAASAPAAKEESAPSERSKREAENVFRWIMIHSDKPRKVRDGKDDVKPPAPVANAPRPAPAARVAKVGEGSAEGAAAAPPASPNPAPAPAARITPAPAATQAVQAIQPAVPVSSVDNEAARMANSAAAHARGGATAMPDAAAPPALAAAPEPEADETLVMVSQVEPQFPRAVMLDLRKGTVRVRFEVLANGTVSAPAVVSSTNVRLNRAALAAVAQWKFQPLRETQEGVVELGFNLD
jgi:TonB family protein